MTRPTRQPSYVVVDEHRLARELRRYGWRPRETRESLSDAGAERIPHAARPLLDVVDAARALVEMRPLDSGSDIAALADALARALDALDR